ncbi:hypothetical protein JCM19046_4547 [Bacillus sp. JCM 19046]|nr:hypothetical protein JCM19045_3701 [Bacillus sp. JCM 19045]GAF19863.1 hypothetical protein JCM19046_4547 [Bacillus sp. JCM 19046]
MKEWMHSWHTLYDSVWQSPIGDQTQAINKLEAMTEQLLHTWGSLDESIHLLKEHVSKLGNSHAFNTSGTQLFDNQLYEEALIELNQEQGIGETENLRYLYIAYSSLYTNQMNEARHVFYTLIQATTSSAILHFTYVGLGLIEMIEREAEKAIHYLEKANCLADNIDVVYNLGVCYYWLGSYDYAVNCFHQFAVKREDADSLMALGLALYAQDRKEECRGVWLDFAEQVDTINELVRLAKITEWLGEHDLACYCYEQIMLINGKESDWLHGFAWNKALAGDDRAIELLAHLAETDKNAGKSLALIQSANVDGTG